MLGTDPAGLGRKGEPLDPKAERNGYPSSTGFVGWTGVYLGQAPIPASPHSLKGRSPLKIISVPPSYPLAHQSSRPREPKEPPSDLPLSLRPPKPQTTCLSHPLSTSPPPAPPASTSPGEKVGTKAQVSGSGAGGLQEWPRLPQPRKPGLLTETPPEAGPGGPPGAYLHTIVLLVSSTLPSYRGQKVEGYQHQAGHQGPQGKEEQHPRAAARWGSGSAVWGHLHLSSSLRWSWTAGSPLGGLGSPVLSDLQWVEGRVQCVLGP